VGFNVWLLLEPIGFIPLAEAEASYYRHLASQTAEVAAWLNPTGLRDTRGGSVQTDEHDSKLKGSRRSIEATAT
jgi:hypothetical protein